MEQSRLIDQRTQDEFDLPAETLMETAGALAAVDLLQNFIPETRLGRIAVLCGPGGNGADGLVMARHLHARLGLRRKSSSESASDQEILRSRSRVSVYLLAPAEKRTELFNRQLARLRQHLVPIFDLENAPPIFDAAGGAVPGEWHLEGLDVSENDEGSQHRRTKRDQTDFAAARVSDFGIWVDALFGVGFRGALEASTSAWVQAINSSSVKRVSLDTPSGLDADRGTTRGPAFRADRTLTFGCAKIGFTVNEGPGLAGQIKILPIGFPSRLVAEVVSTHHFVDRAMVARLKPRRPTSGNKTKFGHCLVFAGHQGMWGAGVLSATAAYRIGSGYVTLASHDDPSKVVNQHPEILTQMIESRDLWDGKWKVAAVGPGLGTGAPTKALLKKLIQRSESGDLAAAVVDADAITVAAKEKLFPLPSSWVCTPHAGELARILLSDEDYQKKYPDPSALSKEIEKDRFHFASEAARITGGWILLKGFRTVVTHAQQRRWWVIGSGNAALAKAGTGDVLTGFIAGLLSQNPDPLRAVLFGAFVHGLLADEWLQTGHDILSLESSELVKRVPELLTRL